MASAYRCLWVGPRFPKSLTEPRTAPAYTGPTFYAKDAMTGLRIMNELTDPAARDLLMSTHIFTASGAAPAEAAPVLNLSTSRSPKVRTDIPLPPIPYLDRRVREIA